MASDKRLTAFRLGDEDRDLIARLQEMTGVSNAASVVRLAIREDVAARETTTAKKGAR